MVSKSLESPLSKNFITLPCQTLTLACWWCYLLKKDCADKLYFYIKHSIFFIYYCIKVNICCCQTCTQTRIYINVGKQLHTLRSSSVSPSLELKSNTTTVAIALPLCVYSSTPPGQSWAAWSAPALWWTEQGCWPAGHEWAGRSEHSRGSRSGESAWRRGQRYDLARNSPSSRPPGRCSLLVHHISCRGRQNTVKKEDWIQLQKCF